MVDPEETEDSAQAEPGPDFSEGDGDTVLRTLIAEAGRHTARVNLRIARREIVRAKARARFPTPSPEVQEKLDAKERDREALVRAEANWSRLLQRPKEEGGVTRRRVEAAKETSARNQTHYNVLGAPLGKLKKKPGRPRGRRG